MKRRKALKNIGLGVTAGLALPWLTSCEDKDTGPEIEYDGVVAIIGAGAAGLFAADYLIAKGIKVKIFEASSRIGGRVLSIKTSDPIFSDLIADFPIELGADRVLGSDSEWGNLIKLLKVPTVDFRGAETNAVDKYILDGEYQTSADVSSDPDFLALVNFRDNILPTYTGGDSVLNAAGLNPRVNGILNSWLGNAYGTSADRIAASPLGESRSQIMHDGKELTLNINPMSDVLLSRFSRATGKVVLNKAVQSVDYSGEMVTLAVKDTITNEVVSETFNKVIVTAPVSILKAGDIAFNPALPGNKLAALSHIGMDASIRIILEFTRNDFFGTDTAFIFGGTECPSYFMVGNGRSDPETGNRTFALTINGPKAELLTGMTDLEKVQHVLAEMDSVFDGKASLNVRKDFEDNILFVVKDWTIDPFIKGGQSYPMVGGSSEDRIALAEPVNDKLYFAGEATFYPGDEEESKLGEFGTISGALLSGRRAAEELIESIVGEG